MSRIAVTCGKCGQTFKEHHSKIRSGSSVNCPKCATPIVFESQSEDPNVRKALTLARRYRVSLAGN
jgi:DNA-directed RNA polymerase subunit RPC12/RpoP